MDQATVFFGDLDFLIYFLQLPAKEKAIHLIQNTASFNSFFERLLLDTYTEHISLYQSRVFFSFGLLIDWFLANCIKLESFHFTNFPDEGVVFPKQSLKAVKTYLKKLQIWDNTNQQFFVDLVAKSAETLEELKYEVVDPELFIDLLDASKMKDLSIRIVTEKVLEKLLQMRSLTKLKIKEINNE